MRVIGHQLGELFLQAVPTALIILLFYLILRAIFFKPLLAVMAERDARTAGAQKAAEAAQAAAGEKVKQYQEARAKASAEVNAAKERVAGELAAARRDVEATVSQLSAEIARRILQAPRPGTPAREA